MWEETFGLTVLGGGLAGRNNVDHVNIHGDEGKRAGNVDVVILVVLLLHCGVFSCWEVGKETKRVPEGGAGK